MRALARFCVATLTFAVSVGECRAAAPLGAEIQVNTYTVGGQTQGDVGVRGDGAFVVVWTDGRDGSQGGIFGQRFGSNGARLGAEFQVNTLTAGNQTSARIAGDDELLALTDGLLILRWLFGFRGATLVNGAVDTGNCSRCTTGEIEFYLDTLDG